MYVYYTRCSLSLVAYAIVTNIKSYFCITLLNSTEFAHSIDKVYKIKALVLTYCISVAF